MKTLLSLVACASFLGASAFAADYESDLGKALQTAQTQNKMMFVIYGRENCGNCQATKAMIKGHQIKVTASKYVLVDLNCDDRAVSAEFNKRYGKEKFGTTLPFVVVTDSSGGLLASSGGYKDAAEWDKLLHAALKKAAAAPAGSSGAPGSQPAGWPFKTPAASTTAPQ